MTLKTNRQIRTGVSRLAQPTVQEWEAEAGNGAGTIYVPGTNEEFMYVRPVGSNIAVKVRSGSAQVSEGTRVWVGKDFGHKRRTQRVLGATTGGIGGSSGSGGLSPSVEKHAPDHFLNGRDPLWLDQAQIVNLLATPGLLTVTVKAGWAIVAGKAVWIEKQTLDMSSHVPATGALYALIRANSAGVLSVQEGTPVTDFVDLTRSDIPQVEAGYAQEWAARLYAGQTAISWTTAAPDLVDLRLASNAGMAVGEEDGSPKGFFSEIKFPNGSLTDNSDGTVSVDLSVAAGDSTYSDAYASRPANSNAGDLFLPNDGMNVERDTGAAWVPWGPIWPWTKPVIGDFGWINQASATATDERGAITLYDPVAANTNANYHILQKAAPSTPYTITAAFWSNFMRFNYFNFGIGWRKSSDGKLVLLRYIYNSGSGGDCVDVAKCSGPTADVAAYATLVNLMRNPMFLRITDNGTNRISSLSYDGYNWLQLHTVGRTDYLTPDQVCVFVSSRNASWPNYTNWLHWKQT